MVTKIDVADQYRHHLTQVGKSAHTVKAYGHDLVSFALWYEQTNGEDFDPRAVDSREIQEYKSYLVRKNLKSSTINRRLNALRRFFAWAKLEGLTSDSPFEVLESVLIKEQKDTAPRWLNQKEVLALMRAVRKRGSRRDLAIIHTLLGTGLRISELVALELNDLTISDRKGSLRVREGKGSKAREIPLDKRTRKALSNYLEERPEDETERVFLGQRGPLNEPGINYLVTKYAYQAQLEDCTSHTLRHTFAKNLVDAGTPLNQVATLLGHESLDTTKIYTRPSKQDLERAVRRAAGEI